MNINQIIDSALAEPLVRQFLLWAGLGLGVGVAAKIIVPGNENLGWVRTILMGLTGSFLGNYLTPKVLNWPSYEAFSMPGFGVGVAGAVVLVVINRLVTRS